VRFGELLGLYRTRCGWSQSELALKIGVHRNTIASWENGDRNPQSRGEVFRLADELLLSKEERKALLNAAGFSVEHWPADYWNVPYPRNPYFVGREMILQSLRQALVPGAKATALTQAISGLGGIGKTQVAIEYAHRYGEYYEAVLWIAADSLEVATAAYLHLATQVLGLPEQQEAEHQITEVKRWLQKRHGWLLIFDNVEDPQGILSTFIPSKHQGSVLITTRMRDVGSLARSEELPLLPDDEGVLFLLRRAKHIAVYGSAKDGTPADVLLAKDLCRLMDGLPLALDQAGAYIAENGCSLQQYISLYERFRPKLLNRRGSADHPDSVLITFWLSWEQIQERNVLAGKALQFCAFLAPDQIPEYLVQAGIMKSEDENTQLEMSEALGLLHRYSLIERMEQTLSLHRLVQAVMQDVLSEKERLQWMERAVQVVNAAFPPFDHADWPQCERLLPHALLLAQLIDELQITLPADAELLNQTGSYLQERARYQETEPLFQRALAIREQQLGPEHPDIANSLNDLAVFYRDQGKYEQAEPLFQRALAIREQRLEPEHPDIANSLNNLALLYHAQGKYEQAEPLYRRALAIYEQRLGPEHPDTHRVRRSYADLLQDIGCTDEGVRQQVNEKDQG
jgi:tetratricopeptide (TPR) repeat protein